VSSSVGFSSSSVFLSSSVGWEGAKIVRDRARSWRGEGPCRRSGRMPLWWLRRCMAMASEEVEIACGRARSWLEEEGPCRCSGRAPAWRLRLRRAMAVRVRSFVRVRGFGTTE
jgi:hypothetical protein